MNCHTSASSCLNVNDNQCKVTASELGAEQEKDLAQLLHEEAEKRLEEWQKRKNDENPQKEEMPQ